MTEHITTAAELDALPVGSIVLSPIGSDYRKGYDDLWHSGQREWSSELMFEPWISGGPFVAVRIPNRDLIAEARAEGAREALVSAADDIADCIDWSDGRDGYGDNAGYEDAARILRARAVEIGGAA